MLPWLRYPRHLTSHPTPDLSRTSRSNQAKTQQFAIELDIQKQPLNAEHNTQLLKLRLEREKNRANMEGSQGSRMSFEQSDSIQRYFDSVDSLRDDPDLDHYTVVSRAGISEGIKSFILGREFPTARSHPGQRFLKESVHLFRGRDSRQQGHAQGGGFAEESCHSFWGGISTQQYHA